MTTPFDAPDGPRAAGAIASPSLRFDIIFGYVAKQDSIVVCAPQGANWPFASSASVTLDTFCALCVADDRDRAQSFVDAIRAFKPMDSTQLRTIVGGGMLDILFSTARYDLDDKPGLVGVAHVVSRAEHANDALLQAIAEHADQGVCVTDTSGRIRSINPAFTRITGYGLQDVVGKTPAVLKSGRQSVEFYRDMWAALAAEDRWTGKVWNKRKDGVIYPEMLTIAAITECGKRTGYVGIFTDLSAVEATRLELSWVAQHDPLTGLLNPRGLDAWVGSYLNDGASGQSVVVRLDISGFRDINERLGHQAGDKVLIEVSVRIVQILGERGVAARLGGDEFAIVADWPQSEHSLALALRDAIRQPIAVDGHNLLIDASFGAATCDGRMQDFRAVLAATTRALETSRSRGRGQIITTAPSNDAETVLRFEIAHGLADALQSSQFSVAYQPQIDLETGRIAGAEALVRWHHPKLGLISPASFISIAEETGRVTQIDMFVLGQALQAILRADREGLVLPRISVNLSAFDFGDGQLVGSVLRLLAESGVAPNRLEVEITEGVLALKDDAAEQLRVLRSHGIQVAIDDFGIGYSSLGRLRTLPVDRLKIDRVFVRGLPLDSGDVAVCNTILDLASHMNLGVVAEGVENEDQRGWLTSAGCHESQGFLHSQPVAIDKLFGLLAPARRDCN